MPLFQVKYPANANALNMFMIDIASFEFVPTDDINESIYVLPEDDPYNLPF